MPKMDSTKSLLLLPMTNKLNLGVRSSQCLVPERDGVFSGLEFRTTLWGTTTLRQRPHNGGHTGRYPTWSGKLTALAARHGINPKTVAKWRKHATVTVTVTDASTRPVPAPTVLTAQG